MKKVFNWLIRIDITEERISVPGGYDNRIEKLLKLKKKKIKNIIEYPRTLKDNYKRYNICLIGIPEVEDIEKGRRNI